MPRKRGRGMTREEAIKILKSMSDISTQGEALEMAIEALTAEEKTKCVAQIKVDTEEIVRRIKEEYDITDGWIPCSERLPKARESVLIATSLQHDNWVGEGCYWETTKNHVIWKGYKWNATYWDNEVTAWMPLPEPYKGGEDE